DGGYVVAWSEGGEVHARRFAGNGSPVGSETRINQVTTSASQVNVVAGADGGFIVTWSALGPDGARHSYQRVFTATALLGTP
ncbi:MAG: hypothetical protein M3150_08605, partial [Pseudomonadota bacterium]|nr:hypothetical protein [Pseudomonadota bacterium]